MELSIEIKPREIPQDIIREHEVKQRRFHNITLYNMGVILQENGFEYDDALSRYDKQCDGCIFVVRFNLSFYELEIRGYHKLAYKPTRHFPESENNIEPLIEFTKLSNQR